MKLLVSLLIWKRKFRFCFFSFTQFPKLKQNEEKFQEVKQRLIDCRNIEEILNAKIGTLEINLRHQEEAMESLQNDNDSLCKIFKE